MMSNSNQNRTGTENALAIKIACPSLDDIIGKDAEKGNACCAFWVAALCAVATFVYVFWGKGIELIYGAYGFPGAWHYQPWIVFAFAALVVGATAIIYLIYCLCKCSLVKQGTERRKLAVDVWKYLISESIKALPHQGHTAPNRDLILRIKKYSEGIPPVNNGGDPCKTSMAELQYAFEYSRESDSDSQDLSSTI